MSCILKRLLIEIINNKNSNVQLFESFLTTNIAVFLASESKGIDRVIDSI